MGRRALPLVLSVMLTVTVFQAAAFSVGDLSASIVRVAPLRAGPTDGDFQEMGSHGSGTIIDAERGLLVTNHHVVAGGPDHQILCDAALISLVLDVRRPPVPAFIAVVVQTDPIMDIALLKIVGTVDEDVASMDDLSEISFARIKKVDDIEFGEDITILGFPGAGAETITITRGSVSGFADVPVDSGFSPNTIKTDALITAGNSGGGAFDTAGNFIGIPTFIIGPSSVSMAMGFLRPIELAEPLLEAFVRDGRMSPPELREEHQPAPDGDYVVSQIVFSSQSVTGGIPDSSETEFDGAATREVFGYIGYQGLSRGMPWSFTWRYNGSAIVGDSGSWDSGAEGVLSLGLQNSGQLLPPGEYSLEFSLNRTVVQSADFRVVVEGGVPDRARAGNPTAVRGRITDVYSGQPIEGAVISILRPGATVRDFVRLRSREVILAAGRTDADGHYALDQPVPAGEVYAVVVTADGYPKTSNNSGLDLRTVTEEDFDLSFAISP